MIRSHHPIPRPDALQTKNRAETGKKDQAPGTQDRTCIRIYRELQGVGLHGHRLRYLYRKQPFDVEMRCRIEYILTSLEYIMTLLFVGDLVIFTHEQ